MKMDRIRMDCETKIENESRFQTRCAASGCRKVAVTFDEKVYFECEPSKTWFGSDEIFIHSPVKMHTSSVNVKRRVD